MAKAKRPSPKSRKSSGKKPRFSASDKMADMVNQVREPLSLLHTLREEGVANVAALMGLAGAMASGASRNLRLESIKPQLRELIGSMGFALRADLERLESRLEELELRLSEKEFEEIREQDEE